MPLGASKAAIALQAPAAHNASCSIGPTHHIDRIRTTQARAVGEPSLAISATISQLLSTNVIPRLYEAKWIASYCE